MNRRAVFGFLVTLPAALVALGGAWSLVAGAASPQGGLWPPDVVTLSEAAAIASSGEVERLVRHGGDPNRRARVSPGILTDGVLQLTPIESAVWSRNEAMARQLVGLGAVIDDSTARRLRCLHEAHPDASVRAWLEQVSTAPWPTCVAVDTAGLR